MMMDPPLSVTVMGDLIVEVTSRIAPFSFQDVTKDTLIYRSIDSVVGGTAGNFAQAAVEHFERVDVLCCVGTDAFGSHILSELGQRSISTHGPRDPHCPTAVSLYLRDASALHSDGVRLVLIRGESANDRLSIDDVESHRDLLRANSLLVLDGYCFRQEPRAAAARRAVEIAHEHGNRIALDVVPHDAHRFFDLEEAREMIESVDVVTVEVRTIRRLMGLDSPDEVLGLDLAMETAQRVMATFGERTYFLRFGRGNIDESLQCVPGRPPRYRNTGYTATPEPRGFGDRLSARELARWLEQYGSS